MAQTKPKAGQFYGVSDNGTDGQFLKTDGTGGMSWESTIVDPTITSIDYPGTATAADPAGGESVIINGTLFASGITCTVGGTSAVTAFNSATQITITTPAKAAGQYAVAVTNLDGGTVSQANFIQYSGVPVWSTAAGNIGSVQSGLTASFQVTATEGSDTIEYAVTTGTLPTGLSLNTNTGAITGTAPSVSASTTTTFSITATDDENQTSSARSFNITVTPDLPSNHFTPVIWSGNGSSTRSISTGFESDMIWIKSRNYANNHYLIDSIRDKDGGTTYENVYPNLTSAQANDSGITAIGSTSFTTGSARFASNDWVAWAWKAGGAAVSNTDGTITSQVSVNNTLGFSIAKYAGNGTSGATYGHGLDATPELILNKVLNYNQSWWAFTPTLGANKFMQLNTTAGTTTDSDYYYSVSSSLVTLNGPANPPALNQSGKNYITYNFTSKPGFSKVGTYTGARPNDVLVQTGFKPAFIMIKADATDDWFIVDDQREGASAPTKALLANSGAAESSYIGAVEFLTNGFKLVGSGNSGGTNNSGTTFIYLAIAADPSTTTPSLANSFATELYTGNNSTNPVSVGFAPDFSWIKCRTDTRSHTLIDTIRGATNILQSESTGAQWDGSSYIQSFDANGFTVKSNAAFINNSSQNYVSWNWKAEGTPSINTDGSITSLVSANQAAGFSVVQYTGTGSNATIGHGLGATPQLIIDKVYNTAGYGWTVYSEPTGTGKYLTLNSTGAVANDANFCSVVGSSTITSYYTGSSQNHIAYFFTSIAGYSKIGSYTGTGGSHTVTTGFEPGFVMWKCTSNAAVGYWVIIDSKRSPTNPKDDELFPNDSAAEYAGNRNVNFTSTGFELTSSSYSNNSGETYIYLAIKEN